MDLIARRVENRKESADHPGLRGTARRANIWRERLNSKDGVEWVAGRLLTRRDSSDQKSLEQLGARRMAKSTPSSEEGSKHPEGCQVMGKAHSLQKDPSSEGGGHSVTYL